MKMKTICILFISILCLCAGCKQAENPHKIDIIFDTDANNELDDQHALAYLMLNDDIFNILGITTNATRNGGDIGEHYKEAERVIKLCNREESIKLLIGAEGSFEEIKDFLDLTDYDGHQSVDFIIEQAHKYSKENKLPILAVGKLTNIALALKKDPSITDNIRLIWLGSNYPGPGEYNLEDDVPSMNYVLESGIHFELVPARYNEPSGTDAVKASLEEIQKIMPGLGPKAKAPVIGRHGESFTNFGDYSVNLFSNAECHGDPPSRALFDMAAVAIVKNPEWAHTQTIPCPIMENNIWIERPDNPRKIFLWENFDKDAIISDFYSTLKNKQ